MEVKDLKLNASNGLYRTPCGTYHIEYVSLDHQGNDCWVAKPRKKGYKLHYGDTLKEIVEKINKNSPELSSNFYRHMIWG